MADDSMAVRTCSVHGCVALAAKRGMCGKHYQRVWKCGDPHVTKLPKPNSGVCEAPGCDLKPRSNVSPYCEMHYMRLRRGGTLEKRLTAQERIVHSGGYIIVRKPEHPLSDKGGRVYEHRFVFYEAYGEGPFKCHVCGAQQTWATMHIDHLNDNRADNKIENLAAACPVCNQARGRHKSKASHRANGRQLTVGTQTKCVSEWAEEAGISRTSLMLRLRNGWAPSIAVSAPAGTSGPKTEERARRVRARTSEG